MKKAIFFALILAILLSGLTACGIWVGDEYRSVTPHSEEPYTEPEPSEEEQPPTVHNSSELRDAVLSMITDWTEHSIILYEDYDGDIADDLADTVRYATKEDPVGAYAVDFADTELTDGSIALNIVFRRSAAEIGSIVKVGNDEEACSRILGVLTSYSPALTLRIQEYGNTDFASFIRTFCIEHPEQMLALPDLSAQVYPKTGETRILELHMIYADSREDMRVKQDSVNTILASASNYVRNGKDDAERVDRLCRFLTTRFSYTVSEDAPSTPAYSLLCEGSAHSLSFASVFFAECREAAIDCRIIRGQRGDATHYWNMIRLNGEYYYIDLMRSIEAGASNAVLLTTQELEEDGYRWDRSELPDTPLPTEPPEPTVKPTVKPTEPTEKPTEPTVKPTEPTEKPTEPTVKPTEPTVKPTEPTQKPTEPTETSEPTEPTAKPTEPTESSEPTEPTEVSVPTEATEGTEKKDRKIGK